MQGLHCKVFVFNNQFNVDILNSAFSGTIGKTVSSSSDS